MSNLSEDIVKKVALAFLKGYYKYRPRGEGETIARLDMVAPGGIIADGHLTFKKEDGSPFLATFEATAWDSREEVAFHRQPVLLNMDSLAVGILTATLVLGFLYEEKWPVFQQLGKYSTGLIYILLATAFFFLTRLLAGKARRYRYIYAIEQFRQYFADQQWIALAEDVFPDPTDKNLKELKNQCVREGYGLLMIDPNQKAYLVVTPARVQEQGKQRRIVRFEDAQAWAKVRTEKFQETWKTSLPRWFRDWLDRFYFSDFSPNRFRRSYFNQTLLMAAGLAVSGVMLYDLFKIPPVRFADEDSYVEELELITSTGRPETGEFLIDTPFVDQYHKTERTRNPMEDDSQAVAAPPKDTVVIAPADLIPGTDGPPPAPVKQKPQPATPSSINAYDCDRFYGIRGSRYLVLYDLVGEESVAREKLDTISGSGIEGGLVWMGCFEARSGEFAIYLGTFFTTPEEAYSQKEKFEIILREQGVRFKPLRIRPLVFKG